MLRLLHAVISVAAVLLAPIGQAGAAPPQLLNKTITLSWVTSTTARGPSGGTGTRVTQFTSIVYVSSAGRLFVRGSRSVNSRRFQGSKTRDIAPGENRTADGLPRQMAFRGNQLVGVTVHQSGATQVVATFDAGFSSCSLNVTHGKAGGAAMRVRGTDDKMYDVISMSASGASCSIRDGNAFAGQ